MNQTYTYKLHTQHDLPPTTPMSPGTLISSVVVAMVVVSVVVVVDGRVVDMTVVGSGVLGGPVRV